MSRFRLLIMIILPLILNIFLTPMIVILGVSLTEFLSSPTYYIYAYGFILWSIYHVFLFFLTYYFLKAEKETLKQLIGPITDKTWQSIVTVSGLLILSIILFQLIEATLSNLIYGPDSWEQFLNEYQRLPLGIIIYGIVVTSLTAGICEEVVWRGYIQTRLESLFKGRILLAVTIQALIFGLWHSVSLHTLFTAIYGLVAGIIYSKTRRLIPIMIGHWLGDVISFSAMYFM